jgi:hypothetical protein
MSEDERNGAALPTMTALVNGIVADVQQLIAQQTQLLRLEIRDDLRKARTGAIFLGMGLGVTLVGGLLFCLMPPYLLNWAANLPLWTCFGICGLVFLLLGATATYVAAKKLQSAAALPESMAALKENFGYFSRRK